MTGALTRGHRSRGFTLIEMMVVVIIVSVLALLAIVGYRRLILSSNVSEANNMVQNIRVAQESYHSETLQYANVSPVGPFAAGAGGGASWYPNNNPNGQTVTAWGLTCTVCNAGYDWSVLPLHVDGPVRFGYATLSGVAGSAVSPKQLGVSTISGGLLTLPSTSATDWYMVAAMCDLDGQGAPYTHVYTTSWGNQLYLDNEGY